MKERKLKIVKMILASSLLMITLAGCGDQTIEDNDKVQQEQTEVTGEQDTSQQEQTEALDEESAAQVTEPSYVQITQQEAKELMEMEDNVLVLDVRTQEEYASGHIKNAQLLPHDEITERAEAEIADKEQLILVYCRSGNRSKAASESLAEMGYKNVREFGGINSWPYEIVTQ